MACRPGEAIENNIRTYSINLQRDWGNLIQNGRLCYKEGSEDVKWELGLADFALGKWGSSHTGTGIWSLGMGKKC